MKSIKVKCSYVLDVLVDDKLTNEDLIYIIETNGCPATGVVGRAFDRIYEAAIKNNTCWACSVQGKNIILY